MKTIVKFAAGGAQSQMEDLIIDDVENIGFTEHGMIVLTDNEKKVLGVFIPGNVAGVYHPNGRDKVIGVSGSLIQV